MDKTTGQTNIVTESARPVGAVSHCPCGRWNDSGLVRECPDCERPVRGVSGFMGRSVHEDAQAFHRLEEETLRWFAAQQILARRAA